MAHYLEIDGQRYPVDNVSYSQDVQQTPVFNKIGQKQTTAVTATSISGCFETDQNININVGGTPKMGTLRVRNGAGGEDLVLQNIIISGTQVMAPDAPMEVDFVAESMTTERRYSKLTETFK